MSEATDEYEYPRAYIHLTDNELMGKYNSLLVHAKACGVPHTPVKVFANRSHMLEACTVLFNKLSNFKAGVDAADESNLSPGLRRLRAHPNAEAIRQATLADNQGARAQVQEKLMNTDTTTNGAATPVAEPRVRKPRAAAAPAAKAAKGAKAAKTAKGAKVAKGKQAKPAARGAKKAVAAKAPAVARARDDDDKIITGTKTTENTLRAGTIQHERRAFIIKCIGKSVAKFIAAGGDRTALNRAVAEGIVTKK